MKQKTWMSWSSGKDSAYSLWRLQQSDDAEVTGLLTTVNADKQRVAMHATRKALLDLQGAAVGVPVIAVDIPQNCSNATYEERMRGALDQAKSEGVAQIAFGDLFLEDIRRYRENMMADQTIEPIFPIWGEPTDTLGRRMVDLGFEAYITCVDPKQLPASFAGQKFDHTLLDNLPANVDPCGENGEFHTFVFDGPNFMQPIQCTVGEILQRDGFVFADIRPL